MSFKSPSIIFFAVFLFSLFFPASVRAVPALSSPSARALRQEIHSQIQEKRATATGKIQAKREKVVARLRERIQTLLANHTRRLKRRFDFYVMRFTDIIGRFQTRLDYLKEQGKNTASAQTKLDAASAKLNEAKIAGEEAIAAFQGIDPSLALADQRAAVQRIRQQVAAARNLFWDVHSLLGEALAALKLISPPAPPAASTAVTNTLQ